MITNFDPEYKDTLELKKGERILPEISKRLISWINNEYEVNAINIYYDRIIPDDRPRIQVIFENFSDVSKFSENGYGNYLPDKQKSISKKYIELVKELKLNKTHPTNNVFVSYSEFSNMYNSSIYYSVPKNELNKLIEKYQSEIVWQIRIDGSWIVVFFYTNRERDNAKNDLMIENLKNDYYTILKPYDEFNYLDRTWIKRESKEDFDTIYKGNWFYWGRDN